MDTDLVLHSTLPFLRVADLAKVESLCGAAHKACSEPQLWHGQLQREFDSQGFLLQVDSAARSVDLKGALLPLLMARVAGNQVLLRSLHDAECLTACIERARRRSKGSESCSIFATKFAFDRSAVVQAMLAGYSSEDVANDDEEDGAIASCDYTVDDLGGVPRLVRVELEWDDSSLCAQVHAEGDGIFLVDLHASCAALKVHARGIQSGLRHWTDCLISLLGPQEEVVQALAEGLTFVVSVRCADEGYSGTDPTSYMGINALNVEWRGP